ncbi:MAG TPA: tRNA (adenosine(37)-N6)-threonylcarbamoyltransferase complex dimerization subunit type 1 TsaB [Rugosimonospora sp.]|nr:tRNA (adenosine(37)-N6)-threonylcarbamoyltransferase complex dimerization subunit type 1 TsaB [Rugosimonospora sp.]
MLVLVLDSATPAITAALASVDESGVELVAERVAVDARAHGELLAPGIDAVLAQAGAKPRNLGAVVAGVGPGPFTGLRVGLVTAVALCDALRIPAYGVCSLDGIGAAAGPGRVLAVTDARRREVYWARYADGRRLTEPAVSRPAGLPVGEADAAVGDGALRYADVLGLPVRAEPRFPVAVALARLAADRILAHAPGEPLTPLYLRRPDAVAAISRKQVLQ